MSLVATFISISQAHFSPILVELLAGALFSTSLHLSTKKPRQENQFFDISPWNFSVSRFWSVLCAVRYSVVSLFFSLTVIIDSKCCRFQRLAVRGEEPFKTWLDRLNSRVRSIIKVWCFFFRRKPEQNTDKCTSSRLLSFITRLGGIVLAVCTR